MSRADLAPIKVVPGWHTASITTRFTSVGPVLTLLVPLDFSLPPRFGFFSWDELKWVSQFITQPTTCNVCISRIRTSAQRCILCTCVGVYFTNLFADFTEPVAVDSEVYFSYLPKLPFMYLLSMYIWLYSYVSMTSVNFCGPDHSVASTPRRHAEPSVFLILPETRSSTAYSFVFTSLLS